MFLSSTTSVVEKIFLFTLVTFVLAVPSLMYAAQVQVEPNAGTYGLGQTFNVSVQIDPEGNTANAVEASLEFDPAILSVVSVAKNDSSLSNWTTEPTYSNSLGTVDFGGVSSMPFTASSNLLSITFRALAPGSGGLIISNASVFATDGLRTDVFTGGVPATFTVSSANEFELLSTTDEDDAEEITDMPMVWSEEFADSEVWYNFSEGTFTWDLSTDVEAVAVEIALTSNNRPNNNPDAIYETPIDEFAVTSEMLSDGEHYLSLRFRTEDGWGEVLNRKILIDTTPPEDFSVSVHQNANNTFPTLRFEAVDFTSGVAYYDVAIDGDVVDIVTLEEGKYGYQLSRLEDGVYDVAVTAYDSAGNSLVSSLDVEVTAGWLSAKHTEQDKVGITWSLTPSISILILAFIIVLLLFYIYFERKQMLIKEAKIAKETYEIQEQMEKIFSALRDEIFDQINTISKRKRLSKAEKEAVEGLSQAIEVSETLIEKEINDVKSMLK